MKDIVITEKKIKKELYILLGCFVFASILNVISIVLFKTAWQEVFTQIGYVLIIAFVTYLLMAVIRLAIRLFLRLFSAGRRK